MFSRLPRAVSHGCVRVEKPIGLATHLFDGDKDEAYFLEMLDAKTERTLTLPTAVPVHLEYRTAWVDASGRLQFRTDIYDIDRELTLALAGDDDAPRVVARTP